MFAGWRGYDGGWDAVWGVLADSVAVGRVDWVCGEATAQILSEAHATLLERRYGEAMKKEQKAFEDSLSR